MSGAIGRYEVIRKLGEGAMGEVLLARDAVLGREVALKTIRSGLGGAEARDRFFQEAKAAARISHPHAVTVHDFGEADGRLFLAMEFVPGQDLSALLKVRALSPAEILEVLAQVAEALAAAHGLGIVHRDVKPSNIRVQRLGGRLHAKLMDFGIARLSGSDLTDTGVVLGTFGYMAPEYLQSGHADARSDLFALGVVLHEALAGQNPFHGDTTGTVIYRILHEEPPRLEPERLAGLSPSLQQVLDKVLQKDPQRRMGSALELAECLRSARDPRWTWSEGGLPTVRSTRADVAALVPPEPLRRPRWPWVAGLLLLAGLGTAGWKLRRPASAPPPPGALPDRTVQLGLPPQEPPPPAPEARAPGSPSLPAAQPRPEPSRHAPQDPPRPVPPKGPETLDEAEAWLDRDPAAALACLDRHLAENPTRERAVALRLVALHALNRPEELRRGLVDLRRQGISIRQLALRVPRFGRMLEAALADGTIHLPRPPKEAAPEGRRPWFPRRVKLP